MIFNRIGDAAFLIALFLIYERTGSLGYHTVFAHLATVGEPSLVAIGLLLFVGRCRQVSSDPALSVAGGRHGGPDPGFRAHPRCDDGDRGRLPHVPHQPDPLPGTGRGPRGGDRGRGDGAVGRHHRLCPGRHQEDPRLLDHLPARLHVLGGGRRRLRRRHLPHAHARLLQGPALPRRRLGHPRHERQPGREDHGRPRPPHADHGGHLLHRLALDRRRTGVLGLLVQGGRVDRTRSPSAPPCGRSEP